MIWCYTLCRIYEDPVGPLRTTSTIIGDYYFKDFLNIHPWFKPPKPVRFPFSPYCARGRKRQLYVSELLPTDVKFIEVNHDSMQVHDSGHFIDTVAPTGKSNKLIARVSVI